MPNIFVSLRRKEISKFKSKLPISRILKSNTTIAGAPHTEKTRCGLPDTSFPKIKSLKEFVF